MAGWFMPFVTKRPALTLSIEDREQLEILRSSRSEEKRRVLHAAILLDAASGMSDGANAANNGVNRHTVALCVRKFFSSGWRRHWEIFPEPAKLAVFRMMRLPGCCTVLVKSRRSWATPTNCGHTRSCRCTCASTASKLAIRVCCS